MAAAGEAESIFGLAEAAGQCEHAPSLWDEVERAEEVAGLDLATLCSRAAGLASQTGAAPRAVKLTERAIELTDEGWEDLAADAQ